MYLSIGKEIDGEGWEYGSSFSNFSIVNQRRTSKSIDCVRRRRWIRTRVYIPETLNDHSLRPLTVFWDISILENGSRKVDLRSGFQVVNELSFSIFISLRHDTWATEIEFGPITIGEKFSVPLLNACANWIRIKPDFPCYEWSSYYQCSSQSYDFSIIKESLCKGFDDASTTHFRISSLQKHKSLLLKLVPYVKLTNVLPCMMTYRCCNTVDSVIEEGDLLSGNTVKLSHVNFSSPVSLAIKVGNYSWSDSVVLNLYQADLSTSYFELTNANNKEDVLILVLRFKVQNYSLIARLFSKCLLIDKTNLDVSICSKNNMEETVIRRTWSEINLNSFGYSTSHLPRQISTTVDKIVASNNSYKVNPNQMKLSIPDDVSTELVKTMRFNSSRSYYLKNINIGQNVYSDSNIKWKYFPTLFQNQTSILTSSEDMMMRAKNNIEILLEKNCVIFLFVDITYPPYWLESEGFKSINDIAVAQRIENEMLEEFHYSIFAKHYSKENGSLKIIIQFKLLK